MAKTEQNNKKAITIVAFIAAGIGICFVCAVYLVITQADKGWIADNSKGTMQFLESVCRKYEDYRQGTVKKDLQVVTDKAKVLSVYLQMEDSVNTRTLREFVTEQNLTGVYVLDDSLKAVYEVDLDRQDREAFLQAALSEQKAQEILKDTGTIGAEQITVQGHSYEYAAVARRDTEGIILCYRDVTTAQEDTTEFSMASLLADDTFEDNAIIVVTDGLHVVGTNRTELSGLTVEECPVTDVSEKADMEAEGLAELHTDTGVWYGVHEPYRSYYLYVFYDAGTVFSNRPVGILIAAGGYVLFCLVGIILWQYVRKKRLSRLEKEYHLVNAIASIYSTNLLIRLEENTWEPVIEPDILKPYIDGVQAADTMMECINTNRIHAAYREGFREFVRMDTMHERLREKAFIGITLEDVEHKWYQALLIPQRQNRKESVRSVMLVFRNVTEQKKREMEYQEQLRNTAEEAKRANAAKTDFLRRMSHDIRTPINGIRGMANIGRENMQNTERLEECFDKIMGASDFLLDLVNSVLDMSKLETGDVELEAKPFDLRKLLDESCNVIAVQAANRNIEFRRIAPEGMHWHLIGSPLHVRQVLQNIISNAVKYNRENGMVEVSCREIASEAGKATYRFVCRDTGIGMSEEFQKHAFDTFAQEHESARTSYAGTGLGLPIAKKLVEHMGGSISFESAEGKGTVFTIVLQFKIDPADHRVRKEPHKTELSLKGLRILLVEDNALNMEISEYMLEEKGAQVTQAHDGREAVDCFAASAPGEYDVILMDIMMPVMDGLEATRQIRALDRTDAATIPILAMSANAFSDDIARSRAAGMNAHLSKPLDFDAVCEAIRNNLPKPL